MFRTSLYAAILGLALGSQAHAGPLPDQVDGWAMFKTSHQWQALGKRVTAAIKASPINKLSQASATMGARSLGKTIKGNMIIFAYGPQFAVRMLDASIAAGMEAPLRFYITENDDGGSTLSYKIPSIVFDPYDDGGAALDEMAAELDDIFATIAAEAAAE